MQSVCSKSYHIQKYEYSYSDRQILVASAGFHRILIVFNSNFVGPKGIDEVECTQFIDFLFHNSFNWLEIKN